MHFSYTDGGVIQIIYTDGKAGLTGVIVQVKNIHIYEVM